MLRIQACAKGKHNPTRHGATCAERPCASIHDTQLLLRMLWRACPARAAPEPGGASRAAPAPGTPPARAGRRRRAQAASAASTRAGAPTRCRATGRATRAGPAARPAARPATAAAARRARAPRAVAPSTRARASALWPGCAGPTLYIPYLLADNLQGALEQCPGFQTARKSPWFILFLLPLSHTTVAPQVMGRAHGTPGFARSAAAAAGAYRGQFEEAAAAVRAARAALGAPAGGRLAWRHRPDPDRVRRPTLHPAHAMRSCAAGGALPQAAAPAHVPMWPDAHWQTARHAAATARGAAARPSDNLGYAPPQVHACVEVAGLRWAPEAVRRKLRPLLMEYDATHPSQQVGARPNEWLLSSWSGAGWWCAAGVRRGAPPPGRGRRAAQAQGWQAWTAERHCACQPCQHLVHSAGAMSVAPRSGGRMPEKPHEIRLSRPVSRCTQSRTPHMRQC